MRRRTRSRSPWQEESTGHSFFGGTGWLFADLMVALAMVFLVATTVGFPTPPKPTAAHHTVAKSSPAPKKPEPALDLIPVTVTISDLDYNGLLSNSPSAVNSVRKSVLKNSSLKSREAGLVLLFGGAGPNNNNEVTALKIDGEVQAVLDGLGKQNVVFQVAAYRNFIDLGRTPGDFHMDIYLFKTS